LLLATSTNYSVNKGFKPSMAVKLNLIAGPTVKQHDTLEEHSIDYGRIAAAIFLHIICYISFSIKYKHVTCLSYYVNNNNKMVGINI
jgi:hypothetical protein